MAREVQDDAYVPMAPFGDHCLDHPERIDVSGPGDCQSVRPASSCDEGGDRHRHRRVGPFSGRIIQLTPTTIGVLTRDTRRDLTEADVLTIVRRSGGDAGRGARWGLAIGAAFGLLLTIPAATDCYDCGWQIPLAGAMFAGIGAGVGAGIGASLTTRELVYSRGKGAPAKVTISPIVDRDRKGVRMALRF